MAVCCELWKELGDVRLVHIVDVNNCRHCKTVNDARVFNPTEVDGRSSCIFDFCLIIPLSFGAVYPECSVPYVLLIMFGAFHYCKNVGQLQP